MLLLGELLGMKSSRGEERNSESEFILSVMPDKYFYFFYSIPQHSHQRKFIETLQTFYPPPM